MRSQTSVRPSWSNSREPNATKPVSRPATLGSAGEATTAKLLDIFRGITREDSVVGCVHGEYGDGRRATHDDAIKPRILSNKMR